ncbi:aspartate ammonia-lyase [Scandinavium sp. H11S7]|uniref:aspartate ammonia-lyase n=1 Tax=Scandinavium TaxID=2726810 RepID=UPI00135B2BF9|nr:MULTISPECIES: aspartate ammonia-lyase [Scandinavium]MCS2146792.1 aspartate ammonia-lyase [Scandinavium manionii]MCS2155419.1 aspartate ammonia-lyase [Scandinavium hiltneri]
MRTENDALGSREIEDDHYYGIQTQRALENFSISGITIDKIPSYIDSLLLIKKSAAIANHRIGKISNEQVLAISQAADEFLTTPQAQQFPLDIYQGGGGTSTNMNVNEVLANRANEILTGKKGYDVVHPNTHINMCQSTNDVIPAAMKMSIYKILGELEYALSSFVEILGNKVEEFTDIVKIGRTCLQDALPLTLGQQFSGYCSAFERSVLQINNVRRHCLELPMGATAIGTEFGTYPGYKDAFYHALHENTGINFTPEKNFFDALQNADFWITTSAVLKSTANILNKLASDLRLMASGPRAGLAEITLPAVQPGSSIMPGKINPVIPEMAIQVYFRILGNDLSITRACEGELELNVWESLILNCISESCRLLTECLPLFSEKCIKNLIANRERCAEDAGSSLALSTVIATIFDYKIASEVARKAETEGKSIYQIVVESGLLSTEKASQLLEPSVLTCPELFNELYK